MIARCMARMRGSACAACANRRVCPAGRWQQVQGWAADDFRRSEQTSGLATLLASVVRAIGGASAPPAARCFSREVEEAIVPLLATGDANIDKVAERLGFNRQTLYRRLRAEGTTFDDLLRTKRRQLAIRYLGVERVPVKVAAWRLGFSDPAAFSRAFKRWTGTAPSRFRSP